MNADLLTVIPRRGLIGIRGVNVRRYEGWFHVEDGFVMRRGLADVRSWRLCPVGDIIEFIPDPIQS